jgi:Tfp pilus assembly protein PilF
MSLLLDALKKAGQDRQNEAVEQKTPRTADELALEELPEEQQRKAVHARPEPARDAGKKLFAAKTALVRGRIQLGIIPIALISGAVIAAAGGIYVWYEMTPHRPAVRALPPPYQPSLPASPPAAPLALTPPPAPAQPLTPPMESAAPGEEAAPAAMQEAAPAALAADEDAPTRAKPEPSIRIENRQETNSIDPVLASAYRSYRQGDFAAAQQQYASALKQDPRNLDALLGIAAIAQQEGQDGIAARYYQHVLALDPRDPVAHAGMAALSNDDSPTEESRLKLLLAQQPQSATLNFALGNLYAEQQRWSEAQQSYFNAYNLQPDSADYALNLAVSLDHLGQGKAAAEYYRRALQLGSTSRTAGFDRAQVQQRLNALRAP